MDQPEYLICIECETPCYVFEWHDGEVTEAFCETCGADEVDVFTTEEEFEALTSGG
jgi:uncharacterized Zn finger protein (UPF0148 family)